LALRATAGGGYVVDKALRRWPPAIKRSMGQTGRGAGLDIHGEIVGYQMLIAPEQTG
jgi:hypothetical protein